MLKRIFVGVIISLVAWVAKIALREAFASPGGNPGQVRAERQPVAVTGPSR